MPTLYGKEGLTSQSVRVSDTASVAGKKSLDFNLATDVISTNALPKRRFVRWNIILPTPQDFAANGSLYANVMVPAGMGNVNIAVSFLKDTTVVLNSDIYTVSSGAWHRQLLRFPAASVSGVTGVRLSLSFPNDAPIGALRILIDGVIYSLNGTETIWNDCSGSGEINTLIFTSPTANTTVSSPFSVAWTGGGPVQIQLMNMTGTIVKDTIVNASPCQFKNVTNGQYQLRGRFQNATQWTSTIVFTVSNVPEGVPVITSPVANGNYQNPVSVTWTGTGNTEWQIMNMAGTVLQNPTSATHSIQLQNLSDGQYQLRGRFVGSAQWTSTVIFNVITVTAQVPSITSPVHNSTGNPLQTVVRYSGNTPEYEITIARDYAFAQGVGVYTTTNQSSYTLTNLLPSTTYYLKMRGKISSGYTAYSAIIDFMTVGVTGVEDNNSIPTSFSMSQNYPNPFNPTTTIKFSLPSSSTVKISIYDITGREVKQITDQEFSGGTHSVRFDGAGMASGMYIYAIQTKFGLLSKKMTLVK